jgi:flagellar motor protein MotB
MARVERVRAREHAMSVTHCKSRYSRTPRCLAERAQRFAAHQNALIDASIARVAEVRTFEAARNAEIARSMAAVEARRTRELEIRQNALIEASLAAAEVERQRRFEATQNALATASVRRVEEDRRRQLAWRLSPCTSQTDTRTRCIAQRARDFVSQQRAIAAASTARVEAERARAFAAARNAEADRSIAAVANARLKAQVYAVYAPFAQQQPSGNVTTASVGRTATISAAEYAALTSHCARAPQSPRCEAERIRDFAAARNAEIERSIAAVARNRASIAEQASLSHCAAKPGSPRCEAERSRASAAEYAAYTSHCVRAPDSPRCEAERVREFAAARNAEINRSIAAVAAERARTAASQHANMPEGASPLETGAISVPAFPGKAETLGNMDHMLRQDISADPCRVRPFDPLQFTRGATLEPAMMTELDRLAGLAENCPGVRIEVHGYADGGSPFNNRNLSQARAQAVTDYLIANGVAPNRVAAIGRGGARPVLPYSKGFDPSFGGRAEFVVRDPSTDAAARRVMWELAELLDPTYIPPVANLSP